jgi:hypothetical protein
VIKGPGDASVDARNCFSVPKVGKTPGKDSLNDPYKAISGPRPSLFPFKAGRWEVPNLQDGLTPRY